MNPIIDSEVQEMMEKIYSEIKVIRKELDEIKQAIIEEDEPDEDELQVIHDGEEDIKAGKVRSWRDIKKDLRNG